MPRIEVITRIQAPINQVFDLARSVELHEQSQRSHRERAVAGATSGLLELDDEVTWEAVHFGIRQRLTSRITQMRAPTFFRDSQVSGAFKRFDHDHQFESLPDGSTRMTDVFNYTAPFGPLGRLADALFLKRYMTRLLEERNHILKQVAEP